MTTLMVGLSAAPQRDRLYRVQCNTTGLKEGACVVWDSTDALGSVKAPTAALNMGFAGVIADVLPAAGTTAGNFYNVQRTGVGYVLLDAGQAVTVGNMLVISDTDGSVRAYSDGGGDDNCDVIGKAMQTLTAGSNNDLILVDLDAFTTIDQS